MTELVADSEDYADLEEWKRSQQKTVELIIGLLPPEQRDVQLQQLQLMKQLSKLPITQQRELIEHSVLTLLPTAPIEGESRKSVLSGALPPPQPPNRNPWKDGTPLKRTKAEETELTKNGFLTLKAELAFLEKLQQLLKLKGDSSSR